MTRLTKDEQYTMMTLFTILRSPLIFGGNMPDNDAFTLSLLTNKEVLKMHGTATNVRQIYQKDGKVAITSKDPKNGDTYLALFNISADASPMNIGVDLAELGISNTATVKNMWTNQAVGTFTGKFEQSLASHACGLYKISAKK